MVTMSKEDINQADIIKIISIPFKSRAKTELPVREYIYILSIDHLFAEPSTVRKIVNYSIEKGYLEIEGETIVAKFKALKIPVPLFPCATDFKFSGVDGYDEVDLPPLPEIETFKPVGEPRVEKPKKIRVPMTEVRVIRKLPRFIGSNSEVYGPFDVGKVVKIPTENAMIFEKRRFVSMDKDTGVAVKEEKAEVSAGKESIESEKKDKKKKRKQEPQKKVKTLDKYF
jgi:hypothetical protein